MVTGLLDAHTPFKAAQLDASWLDLLQKQRQPARPPSLPAKRNETCLCAEITWDLGRAAFDSCRLGLQIVGYGAELARLGLLGSSLLFEGFGGGLLCRSATLVFGRHVYSKPVTRMLTCHSSWHTSAGTTPVSIGS